MSKQSSARALVEAPAYAEAIAGLANDLNLIMLGTSSADVEGLQRAKMQVEALADLDAWIKQVAEGR